MKQAHTDLNDSEQKPAAFGRLCVETLIENAGISDLLPAAFGRLWVETTKTTPITKQTEPAAFGRLCVETHKLGRIWTIHGTSRLRAAVC